MTLSLARMKLTSRSIPRLPHRAVQKTGSSAYICPTCLSRSYTTTTTTTIPSSPPPTAGFTSLPTRRLISLSGPDATRFLQGIVTPNIIPNASRSSRSSTAAPTPTTPPCRGFYGAFLNAQGRLMHDVFIYADPTRGAVVGDSWLVEVDAARAEELYKRIRRYKLRSKFELRLVPEGEMAVWSVWDEGVDSVVVPAERIGLEDARAPGMGARIVLTAGRKLEAEADESSELAYRIRRYMKGVPEGQQELVEEAALPQESNIDYMGGLDYRKGCYVGQELTIRTHHTGVVRKRILPVVLYGEDEPVPTTLQYKHAAGEVDAAEIPHGTSIGRVGKKSRSAGKFLAGVGNVGLGLCRLQIMTDLSVGGEPSTYKEDDEFKLEWDIATGKTDKINVKAFVPSWHLDR